MKKGYGRRLYFRGNATLLAALPILLLTTMAGAADYPTKPLQVVVGFAPGGPTDVAARLVGEELSKDLGQPVVVVNKPGADATIAATFVARSKPDGYTILAASIANLSSAFVAVPDITYKLSDFMPLAQHQVIPLMIATRKDAPWKTLPEFLDDARKNPGKFKVGTDAATLAMLVQAVLLNANVKAIPMIYKGGSPNIVALMGGEVQISGIALTSLLPQLEADKVRILSGTRRWKQYSNYSTLAELGYHEAHHEMWNGFLLPAGTPKPIFERLNKAFKKVVDNPSMSAKLEKIGVVPQYMGPKEFGEYLQKEYEGWKGLEKYKIKG